MSKSAKVMDAFLMAPHKYMDTMGNAPNVNFFSNLIHQPHVKIAGLLVAAFTVAASMEDNKKALNHIISGTANVALYAAFRRVLPKRQNIFYDTHPARHAATPDEAIPKVRKEYAHGIIGTTVIGSATMALSVATYPYVSLMMAQYTFDYAARTWRAKRVLDGDWVASTTPPPRQEKEKAAVTYKKQSWMPA